MEYLEYKIPSTISRIVIKDGNGDLHVEKDRSSKVSIPGYWLTNTQANDFTITDVTCVGDQVGSIVYTGTDNAQFVVVDDVTGSTIGGLPVTSLPAGTYIIQRRENGCVSSAPFTINGPQDITVTFNVFQESCAGNDGRIVANVTGGNGNYTYSWSNGANTNDNTGLVAGDYTVTITDGSGCTLVRTVTVANNCDCSLAIIGTFNTAPNCGTDNGLIQVVVTGGTAPYIYTWTDNVSSTNTARGLTAGLYTVIVSDAAGCIDSLTVNLSSANGPLVTTTVSAATSLPMPKTALEIAVTPDTYAFAVALTADAAPARAFVFVVVVSATVSAAAFVVFAFESVMFCVLLG